MATRTRSWLIVILAVVAVVALGATTYSTYSAVRHMSFGRQNKEENDHAIQPQKDADTSGFLVEHVPPLSKANRVGLRPGDIITKYNGMPVTNVRTYYEAIQHNLADKGGSITLTAIRAGKPIQMTAPPGLLGFDGKNWAPFSDTIARLVGSDRLDQATALLGSADLSVLSREEILLARILVLPENDSSQDGRREELAAQLASLVSEKDFGGLGLKCSRANRYKAAVIFQLKAIEADPTDISARENLGAAYVRAGQFDHAGRIVEDIIANHSTEMSDVGWHVLLRIRGDVYESRKNHAAAAADFRKAIQLVPDHDDSHLRMQYLLALARLNNLEQFEAGVALCDKYPTEGYSVRPYDVDALRAFVLVGNGDEVQARAILQKWSKDADAKKWFLYYWSDVTDAADVVDMWNRFTK